MKTVLARAVIILLMLCGRSAYAEETVSESLQWLVVARPNIAIDEIVSATPINKTGSNNSEINIVAHLKSPLKGHPPEITNFVRRWQATAVPGQDDTARPEVGTEYLIFFNAAGDVTNAINLKYPSRKLGVGADPKDVAVAFDFSLLRSKETILTAVLSQLSKLPPESLNKEVSPSLAQKVEVPMASAAWDVLYQSGTCYLLVPNASALQVDLPNQPVLPTVVKYFAPVYYNDCGRLSDGTLKIASQDTSKPDTLALECVHVEKPGEGASYEMRMNFSLKDALRVADYEFQLDADPDIKPQRGMFEHRAECENMARSLQFRMPRITQFVPEGSPPGTKPMQATWKADCNSNDRWGYVVNFELNVRQVSAEAAAPSVVTAAQPTPPVDAPMASSGAVAVPKAATTFIPATPPPKTEPLKSPIVQHMNGN